MTDPRPGQPDWYSSDQTIPLVPDSGYDQASLPPLPEETVVDPLGPSDAWASGPGLGRTAPLPTVPPTAPSAPPAPPAPMAFGGPAEYPRPSAPTWPQRPPQPYPQPVAPAAAAPAPYAPSGFAEPDGPASSLPAAQYQTYAGSSYAGQAWPGAVDPVNYDYGYSYSGAPTSPHPNAVVSLVLGILGLVMFPFVSPVAWYLAARGRRQMKYDPARWAPSPMLTAGLVTGIIGTVFLALAALVVLVLLTVVFAAAA